MDNGGTRTARDTLPSCLQYLADVVPDREIFIFLSEGKRLSFTAGRFLSLAGNFARKLIARGFQRGDVIANTVPNSPERLVTDVGIMLAGCAPMNGQLTLADGSDFFASARKAKCKGVVLCPEEWSTAWRLLGPKGIDLSSGLFCKLELNDAPDLTTAIVIPSSQSQTATPLLSELESDEDKSTPVGDDCQPDDIAIIMTTSGSSGYSKLVPRTHKEIIRLSGSLSEFVDPKAPPKKYFSIRPLGWLGGYPFRTLTLGEVRVLIDTIPTKGVAKLGEIVAGIMAEKCQIVTFLPLEFQPILDHLAANNIKDFKVDVVGTGGSPTKKHHIAQGLQLGKVMYMGYAGTESGLVAANFILDAAKYDDFYVGKALPGVSLRVLDDDGNECPLGKVGNIEVKGPAVFSGYYNQEQKPDQATLDAFTDDGWYKTSDYGWVKKAADGSLDVFVMGRSSNAIDRGGIILYPAWLEAKVMSHGSISDAFILPVKDPVKNQKICLMVKIEPGSDLDEEELATFCRGLFINDNVDGFIPMPDFFKVFKGDEFPETSTGKADLRRMREMAEEMFGVKE